MPSYYQGPRDEYGNRDYARRDAYADRYYGRHDERGSATPEWEWTMSDEERYERERYRRYGYDRRYEYAVLDDYRYRPDYGGERGYGMEEYGRGTQGYGVDRDAEPPPREREWQEPRYARPPERSGYGYWRGR